MIPVFGRRFAGFLPKTFCKITHIGKTAGFSDFSNRLMFGSLHQIDRVLKSQIIQKFLWRFSHHFFKRAAKVLVTDIHILGKGLQLYIFREIFSQKIKQFLHIREGVKILSYFHVVCVCAKQIAEHREEKNLDFHFIAEGSGFVQKAYFFNAFQAVHTGSSFLSQHREEADIFSGTGMNISGINTGFRAGEYQGVPENDACKAEIRCIGGDGIVNLVRIYHQRLVSG